MSPVVHLRCAMGLLGALIGMFGVQDVLNGRHPAPWRLE